MGVCPCSARPPSAGTPWISMTAGTSPRSARWPSRQSSRGLALHRSPPRHAVSVGYHVGNRTPHRPGGACTSRAPSPCLALARARFGLLSKTILPPGTIPIISCAEVLASPHDELTCMWGIYPAWHLHRMAMGETIGDTSRISINLSRMPPVPENTMPGFTLLGLMGDPSLARTISHCTERAHRPAQRHGGAPAVDGFA